MAGRTERNRREAVNKVGADQLRRRVFNLATANALLRPITSSQER